MGEAVGGRVIGILTTPVVVCCGRAGRGSDRCSTLMGSSLVVNWYSSVLQYWICLRETTWRKNNIFFNNTAPSQSFGIMRYINSEILVQWIKRCLDRRLLQWAPWMMMVWCYEVPGQRWSSRIRYLKSFGTVIYIWTMIILLISIGQW